MKKKVKQGESFWKVFWKGGTIEGGEKEQHAPELMHLSEQPGKVFKASIWGMSFPWTLTVSMLIGIWIVFAPGVFGVGIQETVADISHLSGSLIVVVSVICMGEVMRLGRYLNVLLGLVVAVAPWFLDGPMALNISNTIAGLAVAGLAIPLGPKTQTYAGWDEYVK
ncbi:MAG: SPW repeat protein, partial [Hymenobacteraceae bacterium]|nr:SPW repeat protein [Hymenobacteraceae bacterium]MDX5396177.1 SPW repeat protein [Hymenobacteraceae bacterium]MDX5512238.1 SPW repeat protein [Hymenobacteraceae bacterium]